MTSPARWGLRTFPEHGAGRQNPGGTQWTPRVEETAKHPGRTKWLEMAGESPREDICRRSLSYMQLGDQRMRVRKVLEVGKETEATAPPPPGAPRAAARTGKQLLHLHVCHVLKR